MAMGDIRSFESCWREVVAVIPSKGFRCRPFYGDSIVSYALNTPHEAKSQFDNGHRRTRRSKIARLTGGSIHVVCVITGFDTMSRVKLVFSNVTANHQHLR